MGRSLFVPAALRRQRILAGLSLDQAGLAADRCVATIRLYERGLVVPPIDVAARLATACGCSVEDFLASAVAPR